MFTEDFTKAVVKLVQTKTISAFGTATPSLTTLQYLINLHIHYNLTGTPTTIISNASNKQEEFCLAKIKLESIRLFPYITTKNDFDPQLVHGDNIPQDLLTDTTNLNSFTDAIMVVLDHNFLVMYYEKNPSWRYQ